MRILLADDHSLVRDGLKPWLEALAPEIDFLEAGSLPEVLALTSEPPAPELVLLDLHMPGMNGPASIGLVRAAFPAARVVIVSGAGDRATIVSALGEGAHGYVTKNTRGRSLIAALKMVLDGETYVPPQAITDGPPADGSVRIPAANGANAGDGTLASLSNREADALRLLIAGQTNKEIARGLAIEEITVKAHLRNVYRKIGASNRADAVRIAMMQGWT